MAAKKSNYSILVDVDLNVDDIQKQLNDAQKNLKKIVLPGAEKAKKDMTDLGGAAKKTAESVENASLSFQAANEIFSKTVDIISSMAEQVYKLDAAQIEFQKVSDLSGQALDDYVDKLTIMGGAVARTGKPKSQAPIVRMAN